MEAGVRQRSRSRLSTPFMELAQCPPRTGCAMTSIEATPATIDPAAAPLGTDDEAAGHSPTPEEIKLAFSQKVSRRTPTQNRDADHGVALYVLVVLVVA